ncbi:GLPGLI family protein [Polaribacter sp.]|uniref:GLPGLI family protein n=1 Tax=Polaribacter sp. TaxID=1920175 RepID=UPI004047DF4F
MRKLYILFFLLISSIIKSQENKVYVEYEITNLSTGKPIYVKAKLFVDKRKSVYTIDPKDTKYNKEEKATYNENDNSITKIIYKSSDNLFYLITDFLKDSIEFNSNSRETKFIVQEKKHPFKWTIHKERRKIGDFDCIKATTYFRGRNYIAWYSPEIPLNSGPWKFSGLPGLIIEVQDLENLFSWKTQTIIYPFKENTPKEIPNKENYTKIKLKEYIGVQGKNSTNFASLIQTKMPKGSEFRDMKIKRNGIELIYEWE